MFSVGDLSNVNIVGVADRQALQVQQGRFNHEDYRITVQDEGSTLSTAMETLNFVGVATSTGTGATKTITINGTGVDDTTPQLGGNLDTNNYRC